jgi:hypothetical protein
MRALALALCAAAPPAFAGAGWNVEAYVGAPLNFNTPLTIEQSGHPDLRMSAQYETRPFEAPWYWDVRVGRWSGKAEWAIELTHHKIYLTNPPTEVGAFASSHGYNLLTVSRGWELPWSIWARLGIGVVISHPESTVRDQRLGENGGIMGLGYYLSGGTVTAALQKRIRLIGGLYIAGAGMVSASYAVLPVVDGHALVPNVALHALVGVGYSLGSNN